MTDFKKAIQEEIALLRKKGVIEQPAFAKKLHMDAYYYSFEPSGDPEIDLILSAVAVAGKAEHNTMGWTDEITDYTHAELFKGGSPVEWIQNAADAVAKSRAELRAQLATARNDALDAVVSLKGVTK